MLYAKTTQISPKKLANVFLFLCVFIYFVTRVTLMI